ncbi:MAG: EF-hand domain-containing protein [Bacteroidales bacterium]|nr:EF-hand domain-containing protein [Bacteroidales bacterium]
MASWSHPSLFAVAMLGFGACYASAQPPGFGGSFGGDSGRGGFRGRGFSMSDEDMQRRFAEYDRNGDGKISYDEASDRTKPNFKSADTNGDGGLDFNEYKGYITQRMSSFSAMRASRNGDSSSMPSPSFSPGSTTSPMPGNFGGPPGGFNGPPGGFGGPPGGFGGPPGGFDYSRFNRDRDSRDSRDRRESAPAEVKPAERAVAIRYGKLPDNLPEWFQELDIDKDGQVALYEWRKGDKPTDEFLKLDLNGDGLITAEEWLRGERISASQKKLDEHLAALGEGVTTESRSSSSSSSRSTRSPRPDNPFARKR